MIDRRTFLKASAAAAAAPWIAGCGGARGAWNAAAYRRPERSSIAVLKASSYAADLGDVVRRGLGLLRIDVRGARVVLKPNLVEYDPQGVINTHPALIAGTIDAVRGLGAREVIVAEGPGHRRDNEYLLAASGLHDALRELRVPYVDLNNDAVRSVALRTRFTTLERLYLPETVLAADLFISMPKLKTHHWAGATLSMKNLFGIVPGAVYGWPKNALHLAGIEASIVDINAALAVPRLNIVDGIVGMEGDGPIRGAAKRANVLIMGGDCVAVDATGARLMGIDPRKLTYLQHAGDFLGNLAEDRIDQVGDDPMPLRQDFQLIPIREHLRA